jgi:hypothetical protein
MKIMPQTEIEKKRVAWCAEHFKFGMSTVEVFQLIEQCALLFPRTPEERRRKTESLMVMPEFVL